MDTPRLPNDLVARRYKLLRPVGNGNMSSVYQAEDTRLHNRIVALKLLDTAHGDAINDELFRRETRALDKIEHLNIIKVFDSGWSEERQCYYIVFEYIPRTLADEIQVQKNNADHTWCWPLMRSVSDALVHAHKSDVIHRDVKPTNILLTEDGVPKLTDFGISYLKYELGTGVTVSSFWSLGYAAPEQRNGQRATEQSDIYSLGCVFYHLLSRTPPPPDGISQEDIARVNVLPPVRLLLQDMLALDPEKRVGDAVQLRRRLEFTHHLLPLQEVYLIVTDAARKALFDAGYIDDSTPEAARQYLEQELGADDPKDVLALLENDSIRILTDNMRIVCVKDRDMPILVITAIYFLYGPRLERQKDAATSIRYQWICIDRQGMYTLPVSKHSTLRSTLDAFFEQLHSHNRIQKTAQSRRAERKDFTKTWNAILSAQKELLEAETKLFYSHFFKDGNAITFVLQKTAPDTLSWPDNAPLAVIAKEKAPRSLNVGHLIGINGNRVQVAWEPAKGHAQPHNEFPAQGFIGLAQQETLAALERQRIALSALTSGGTNNPRLLDVLQDLSTAQFEAVDEHIEFYQDDLAEDKKKAVRQALATHDLFLLQGPPGTGKTTTLAEIISQILKVKPDARILVSSQSNVAVNHVLSRVAQLRSGSRTEIVRIGRADKISHGAEEWTLEQRVENWRKEVLVRTDEVMKDLKVQIRTQQRAKKQLLPEHIEELEECEVLLEELSSDFEKLAEYENKLAKLKDYLAQSAHHSSPPPEGAQAKSREYEALVQEKTIHIESTLELVRSYIPKELLGYPISSLSEEREFLLQTVRNQLKPELVASRETQLLDLVQQWRKVFGKQEDFTEPIIARANILAATCLITGGRHLKDGEFDWAIIDEAGRATAPELLVPLVRARRAIIVGDERQLPPMLDENLRADMLTQYGTTREALAESLFATLVKQASDEQLPVVQMLTAQHRMHPAIGRLVSHVFYNGKLEHAVNEQDREHGLDWLPRSVIWFSTTRLDNHYETSQTQSYYNRVEVEAIVKLLHKMESSYQTRKETKEVAIITPYNAQISELQDAVLPESPFWQMLNIEIATVDAFQGRDRDIVFYSTVRSNKKGTLGFLKDRRRLNVALSRARQLLLIVGDLWTLENGHAGLDGNPYQELVRYMRDHSEDCSIQDVEME